MTRPALLMLLILVVAGHAAPTQTASSQRGSTSIAGVVVNAATGAPIDGVDVRIATGGEQSIQAGEILTDANGAFRFNDLPEGKYKLQASRRGYIPSGYQGHNGFSTAIVTGSRADTTHLRFPLTPWGVIDGSISDDSGDPVPDAEVRLFRQDQNQGEGRIVAAGRQQSDDRGSFEFTQLRPGSYFICVAATPWYAFRPAAQMDSSGNPLPDDQQPTSSLDVAYPMTFYPNATDSAGATPIPVRGGDHLQISFSLHAVPAVHIRVRVPMHGDNPGVATPQLTEDAFGTPVYLPIVPQGNLRRSEHMWDFELNGAAAGKYEIRQGQAGVLAVDATSSRAVDAPALSSGSDVTGKVAMASGAALPSHAIVIARSVDDERLQRTAGIENDGSFTLHGVPPGVYEVTIGGASGTLTIAQMAASGAEVHGNQVTVGSDPVLLAATLARGSATIDGFAQRNGEGIGGAMIELLPDDPGASTELIRRDQSNSDGSFTLRRVVPGNYTLVAIDDGWTLDWAKHDALTAYLSHGVKIHIRDDEKLQLSSPVPVQER